VKDVLKKVVKFDERYLPLELAPHRFFEFYLHFTFFSAVNEFILLIIVLKSLIYAFILFKITNCILRLFYAISFSVFLGIF